MEEKEELYEKLCENKSRRKRKWFSLPLTSFVCSSNCPLSKYRSIGALVLRLLDELTESRGKMSITRENAAN